MRVGAEFFELDLFVANLQWRVSSDTAGKLCIDSFVEKLSSYFIKKEELRINCYGIADYRNKLSSIKSGKANDPWKEEKSNGKL